MIKKVTVIALILLASVNLSAQNQCKVDNKYFQAGESLTYDLYFKKGLVNMKAGTSTLNTTSLKYAGQDAYKITLVAKSSGMVEKIFSINDTITAYTTKQLVPLAFYKNAEEGKNHTIENMSYTYNATGVSVHTKRVRDGQQKFDETMTAKGCVYDMASIVFYARTLDYSQMSKGSETRVDFISGKKKSYMVIEYQGLENIKANDEKTYSCMKLVLSIQTDAFEDKEESMKVYITNDDNRMPVRLDTKLKFGSTRAMLKSYKGNKYPVSAK
ncbi:hypothetical protein M2451_003494 [Dysgonomonas sp. PFB1-18]|uniref:DUF3108 domain-containing protein n=1 Tax=unclassified Dysgonomonas TaxID=2630389 RepID=UPI002474FEC8|nr:MULTISPECIES: DUF3108 domain-containing protein [unclassified Dysgonomonas]MDH6310739.1 hypothetical protein [Dysgonomonas sp. PF1-14]MDH6340589.1 hypothetical protein [Dysgonomonas sp. PF1-16]MDH6382154.1 hypothetical protein [Dysgonomonas sp. PFB1-18]MDH6399498.1 hypothetical protein [Dysgonomonas sp. PF1-23]